MARPNPTEVSARLLVLIRVVQWEASAPESGADAAALAAGAQRAEAELRERELWEVATPAEQRFLKQVNEKPELPKENEAGYKRICEDFLATGAY